MMKGLVFVISTICVQGLGGALPWLVTSSLSGIDALCQRAVFVASCKLDNDPSYVSAELRSLCEPLNGFSTRQWCYSQQPRGFNMTWKSGLFIAVTVCCLVL
jgi:hypothetical protein